MILYGDSTNFKNWQKAPTSQALEYVLDYNEDGTFGRVYDETYDSATKRFKLRVQNWTLPLNYNSSTYDNNTALLYIETSSTCP